MPELPDVTVYVEHLVRRLTGATLERVLVANPNLLRTYAPPVTAAVGAALKASSAWASGSSWASRASSFSCFTS